MGGIFKFVIAIVLSCVCDVANATQTQKTLSTGKLAQQIKNINFLDEKIQQLDMTVTDDEIVAAYQKLKPDLKLERQLTLPTAADEPQKILLLSRMIDKDIDNEYMWEKMQQQMFINKLPEKRSELAQYMLQFVYALTGNNSQQYAQQEINRAIFVCSGHSANGKNTGFRHVVPFNQFSQQQPQRSVFCVLNETQVLDHCSKLISSLIMQIISSNITNNWISDAKIEIENSRQLVIYAIINPIENDLIGNSLFYDQSVGYFTMFFKPYDAVPYITDSIKIPLEVEECKGIKRLSMKTCYPAQIEQKFRCIKQPLSQQQIQLLPPLFDAKLNQNKNVQQLISIKSNCYTFEQMLSQIVQNVEQKASDFIIQFNNINNEIDQISQACQLIQQQVPQQIIQVPTKYQNEKLFVQNFELSQKQQTNFQLAEQQLYLLQQNLEQIRCNQQQLIEDIPTMDYVVENFMVIPQLLNNAKINECMAKKYKFLQLDQQIDQINKEKIQLLREVQQRQKLITTQLNKFERDNITIQEIKLLNQQIGQYSQTGLQQVQQLQEFGEQTKLKAKQVIVDYDKAIQQVEILKSKLQMKRQVSNEEFEVVYQKIASCEQNVQIIYNQMQQIKESGEGQLEQPRCTLLQRKRQQKQPELITIQIYEPKNYVEPIEKILGEFNKLRSTIEQKHIVLFQVWDDIKLLFKQQQQKK